MVWGNKGYFSFKNQYNTKEEGTNRYKEKGESSNKEEETEKSHTHGTTYRVKKMNLKKSSHLNKSSINLTKIVYVTLYVKEYGKESGEDIDGDPHTTMESRTNSKTLFYGN